MERKKEKKYLVGSIVFVFLTILGVAADIISMLGGINGMWFISELFEIIIFALIGYYAFIGFKKPHGNLLKYIIFMYALLYIISLIVYAKLNNNVCIALSGVEIGLLCYIAGRLAKVKENLILMIAVSTFMTAEIIIEAVTEAVNIGIISVFIIWIDICLAYFMRYKQHREAGLQDAERVKKNK